jgi:pimeloyl-ACP methyl ester carboxylesterase
MKLSRLVAPALLLSLIIPLSARNAVSAARTTVYQSSPRAVSAVATTVLTGTIGGAAYKIEVPAPWNGTLVLYSHGYVAPGQTNPATDVGDPITGAWLLDHGYALAGSSYSSTGWALQQAFQDQTALLDFFANKVGRPTRTIAWGHSLGGIITAGLIQKYPQRFAGALPMCGVLAGGVGTWNQSLDSAFAFKALLAPDSALQLVHITNPAANARLSEQILSAAQQTPAGRARIALAVALSDTPGWYAPTSPEPARSDVTVQEQNQFLWAQNVDFPFLFALRAELEQRAGGNVSSNVGVIYLLQLLRSSDFAEVRALYAQAGLNLLADVRKVQITPRIAADPGAVNYLVNNIVFNGQLGVPGGAPIPVLTMHTTGDGLVQVQQEQAYARTVQSAGNGDLLRQIYVHRAGHCSFTPAETVTAFQTLVHRLDTGAWDNTGDTQALNNAATALGPNFNVFLSANGASPTAPAFVPFHPSVFLRPFDYRSLGS